MRILERKRKRALKQDFFKRWDTILVIHDIICTKPTLKTETVQEKSDQFVFGWIFFLVVVV